MQKHKAVFGLALCLLLIGAVCVPAVSAAKMTKADMMNTKPVVSYPLTKPTESTFTIKVTNALPFKAVWVEYGLTPAMAYDSKPITATREGTRQFTITMKVPYEYSKSVYYRACTRFACGEYKVAHLLKPLEYPWAITR